MVPTFLKTFYRNMARNFTFTVINISGLTLGMMVFILLMQYVAFEKTATFGNTPVSNLYRLITVTPQGERFDGTAPGLAAMISELPGVRSTCRVASGIGNGIISYDKAVHARESFRKTDVLYADGPALELFGLEHVSGSAALMAKPNHVALSETLAETMFPGKNPIGESITVTNQFGETAYAIALVFKNPVENSDFRGNLVLSLATLANKSNLQGNDWADLDGLDNQFVSTWVAVDERAAKGAIEHAINKIKTAARPADTEKIVLQNVSHVHLGERLNDPNPTLGNRKFVYILTFIAFMIIALAWFNYVNLSTANSLARAKEVGIRKTIGASQGQLIRQFLVESLLLNTLGAVLALAIVSALQTPFNLLVGKPLSLSYLNRPDFILFSVMALATGSFISGAYVSFVLTGFNPARVLKGKFTSSSTGKSVRRSLVTCQFAISVMLVAATIVIYSQIQYLKTKDLGMDLNNVLVVRGPEIGRDTSFVHRREMFQNDLNALSFVAHTSVTGCVPGGYYSFNISGITRENPGPGDDKISYGVAIVDDHFVDTYGIRLAAGVNIDRPMTEKRWDAVDKIMLNEAAATRLGFDGPADAVGQKVVWGKSFEIVGVVANYHHTGLRDPVDPIIFYPQQNSNYISVKFQEVPTQGRIALIESVFKKSFPGNPFEFFLADENYGTKYADEQRYGLLLITASCLAICITIIGLLGLTIFLVNQRAKEISLRKILGASTANVAQLVSNNFLTQILIGSLIGLPIAWYGAQRWLESFAYRTSIEWWMLAGAFILSVAFALLTIFFQSLHAAGTNPMRNLRTE